jgi:hypothetical protein
MKGIGMADSPLIREALAFCNQALTYALDGAEPPGDDPRQQALWKALGRARTALSAPREASGTSEPMAAYIEIVERDRATDDTMGGSIIVPNEVRINGTPLLVPAGQTIKVHEMTFGNDEAAQVTLTLFARRITIAAEEDL